MRIGEYRLLSRLSHGHRLDTWDAFDEIRGTRCVVKVLREDRRHEPRLIEAVAREAEIAVGLAHPHLVRGYQRLDDPPGVVLETLPGLTLGAVVEEGALAVADVAELGRQLCSVVGFLHHHGWLHLDIKPGNVVVDHGRAVLIDLSLAIAIGDQPRAGGGTPGYLAPEQARGRDVGPAADVWGLCVTLVECLTGEQPYGDEATWDSRPRRPWHAPLPPPPELPSDVPSGLAELLRAGLELDPAARPRVADLIDGLTSLLGPGSRGVADPPPAPAIPGALRRRAGSGGSWRRAPRRG